MNNWNSTAEVSDYTGADPTQAIVTQVFGIMGIGLGVTAIASFVTVNYPPLFMLVVKSQLLFIIAIFGLVFYLSARAERMSANTAMGWFLVYSSLMGLFLSPLFLAYTKASITSAFVISGGMFGGMSLWGYVTKKDLTGIGSLAFMGLIGIILASIVNIFLRSPVWEMAISYIGVAVFVGLTAYDTQKIKHIAQSGGMVGGVAVRCALALYLDFINLFLFILRIMGGRRN